MQGKNTVIECHWGSLCHLLVSTGRNCSWLGWDPGEGARALLWPSHLHVWNAVVRRQLYFSFLLEE